MHDFPRQSLRSALGIGTAAFALLLAGNASAACVGAGVITRITGQPQDVVITREGRPVARPRILEVICVGDSVRVDGQTQVQMSVDGRGQVRVTSAAPFTVPARSAGRATMAGNAYRQISEAILPDMRRQAWDVRLRGGEEPFAFALPGLAGGQQTVRAGNRNLLVRLAGGAAPYRVEVLDTGGRVLAQGTDTRFGVVVPSVALTEGAYRLRAHSGTESVEAPFRVVGAAPPVPDFSEIEDPEVRSAAAAAALAQAEPNWAFEAEQLIHAAPGDQLDRARIYQLIESYGAGDGGDAAE